MRTVLFVIVVFACLLGKALFAHGQPVVQNDMLIGDTTAAPVIAAPAPAMICVVAGRVVPCPGAPAVDASPWALVAASAFALVGLALRRFAPLEHWLHKPVGMGLSAAVAFVIDGVGTCVALHGFQWIAVASAAIAAATTAVAMYNPTKAAEDAKIARAGIGGIIQ